METVVGLEIHVELKTESKMFCACKTRFGMPPNSQCCPVCMGLPGALPTVNQKAVELGALAGIALHSQVQAQSRFDRKQYFYPDLPKGYQITQRMHPLCIGGFLSLPDSGKRIEIEEMHLEEDAGKITHRGASSYVDLNRCGLPLLEIVTKPMLSNGQEAYVFLNLLRDTLMMLGVTTGKMQEGALRVDVNVSVHEAGTPLGDRTEMKNLSSFKAVRAAIDHEAARQMKIIASGEKIVGETRRWDERGGYSVSMRKKEGEQDYRYFPEPDLPWLHLDPTGLEEMINRLPELPEAIQLRLIKIPGMAAEKAIQLSNAPALLACFDAAVKIAPDAKKILNWLLGDYRAIAKKNGLLPDCPPFTPDQFAALMHRVVAENLPYKDARAELEAISK